MIRLKTKPNSEEEIFNILNPLVREWFKKKFGRFCLPQRYALLEIQSRKNVLVSAPTGSGKTLTAFLSLLNELIDLSQKKLLQDKTYVVYVSPLKALGNDIFVNLIRPLKEMEELQGQKLDIRVAIRSGDVLPQEKNLMLKKPPHILITTPESLAIALASLKFSSFLKEVEWCIIDEIHSLAENKRGVHLSLSLERLQELSPGLCRIGLSATVAPLEEIAKFLVGYSGGEPRDCEIIDVPFRKESDLKVLLPVRNLWQVTYALKHSSLYDLLHQLIQEHKTTLIFTNTRSGAERVVHVLREKFPRYYDQFNLAAHHGSLSRFLRLETEEKLREGKLKAIVSSTSLELGIDIGSVDLVVCLGSPKSVARFIQRCGRSGHGLREKIKARLIVTDRDDLVECSLLLKAALEKKIDQISLPQKPLDVLAQQIYGMVIQEKKEVRELFRLVKQSYCFRDLSWNDFEEVLKYLSGEHVCLEDRSVFSKIWWDQEKGFVGRRGKLARMIYMTNTGTIPEEGFVLVKVGDRVVGKLEESFLERLKPGDVFVLGGEVYEFKFSRGMTIQAKVSPQRPPTIPFWFSERLPLSFDLAWEISRFRRLMEEKFNKKLTKEEILCFIRDYLYLEQEVAEEIYDYFQEQYSFLGLPSHQKIIIEHFFDTKRKYVIFHTLFGCRVNDCFSRALAFVLGKLQGRDVEIGLTDNGFYLCSPKALSVRKALRVLSPEKLRDILEAAIDRSEILKRRFRHCAIRALMILRNYKGKKKKIGRQQLSSQILMRAVKRISKDFPILKEARREVLEDLMDFRRTKLILEKIVSGEIKIEEKYTSLPSPFAFNLLMEGYSDLIRIEEKQEFLQRMHSLIKAKLALRKKY